MTYLIADDLATVIIESNLEYQNISLNQIGVVEIFKFRYFLQYIKWQLRILKLIHWELNSAKFISIV